MCEKYFFKQKLFVSCVSFISTPDVLNFIVMQVKFHCTTTELGDAVFLWTDTVTETQYLFCASLVLACQWRAAKKLIAMHDTPDGHCNAFQPICVVSRTNKHHRRPMCSLLAHAQILSCECAILYTGRPDPIAPPGRHVPNVNRHGDTCFESYTTRLCKCRC